MRLERFYIQFLSSQYSYNLHDLHSRRKSYSPSKLRCANDLFHLLLRKCLSFQPSLCKFFRLILFVQTLARMRRAMDLFTEWWNELCVMWISDSMPPISRNSSHRWAKDVLKRSICRKTYHFLESNCKQVRAERWGHSGSDKMAIRRARGETYSPRTRPTWSLQ